MLLGFIFAQLGTFLITLTITRLDFWLEHFVALARDESESSGHYNLND